ncbi:MAG: hypothetical protein Q8L48_26010 [Archangium sp.]|nr:hypothetical protein [Archangium sp.]
MLRNSSPNAFGRSGRTRRRPHPEELWGIEDPRITWVEELQRYMYYGGADSCVALATGSVQRCLLWLDEHGKA